MRLQFPIAAVVAMTLASPSTRASKLNQVAATDQTSPLQGDVIVNVIPHLPYKSLVSLSLTSRFANESVRNHYIQQFVAKFAAIVSSSGDPSAQINTDLNILKRQMEPITKDFTVPVRSLIHAVGRQKLVTDSNLRTSFFNGMKAMKPADGKTSLVHLTITDYITVLMLTGSTSKQINSAIGDSNARHIRRTMKNNGLGIDGSWSTELTLWALEHDLPKLLSLDPLFLFSMNDIVVAWCTVIDAERRRTNPNLLSPFTPTIVHAVLARMEKVQENITGALRYGTTPIQNSPRYIPLESRPSPYLLTDRSQCIKALPNIGAIIAGLRLELNSASFYRTPSRTRSLLNKELVPWLFGQINRIGIDAEVMWRLATAELDGKSRYTIRDIYLVILDKNYDSLGWPMQRWILYQLVDLEMYSRAADIFKFLADVNLLPADLIAQREKIVGVILASSWRWSKKQKQAWLRSKVFN